MDGRARGRAKRDWDGPVKALMLAFCVAGPNVVVRRSVKRPAAKDICQFRQVSRKGLRVFVPPRMLKHSSELRGAASTQVYVEDHKKVESAPTLDSEELGAGSHA